MGGPIVQSRLNSFSIKYYYDYYTDLPFHIHTYTHMYTHAKGGELCNEEDEFDSDGFQSMMRGELLRFGTSRGGVVFINENDKLILLLIRSDITADITTDMI